MRRNHPWRFYVLFLFLCARTLYAKDLNITQANIFLSSDLDKTMQETVMKIIEKEIGPVAKWNKSSRILGSEINIVLVTRESLKNDTYNFTTDILDKIVTLKSDGFYITQENNSSDHTIWLVTTNRRSTIFAFGALFRALSVYQDRITLDSQFEVFTSPTYRIRGHQIGYRNTANSCDAWSAEQYETYIRQLALFGTNAIENIPLGSAGDDSPHMQISRAEMNRKISAICELYDLDYWVWTPATFDLTDTQKRAEALSKHETFYKDCPRLNDVFFPGGDPGHNHPKEVMPFLKDLSFLLKKYHPEAGIWISLQGFDQEQVDYFYTYLDKNNPDWLRGVVSGPSSPPLSDTRHRLPEKYLHRHYPDITHSIRCDFPAQNWDQAYALTLGREGSNPQPFYYAGIHAKYASFTDGFVSYSDGAHDDVNKFIWSQRGWDPDLGVRDIVVDYCKYFFGKEVAEKAADGILALERNWEGPLAANGGVEMTFAFWQDLETTYPALQSNWRWQLIMLRVYYDTYIRRRLIRESALENQVNKILVNVEKVGVDKAKEMSLDLFAESERNTTAPELLEKINAYAETLYQSIGLQTRVLAHQASGAE